MTYAKVCTHPRAVYRAFVLCLLLGSASLAAFPQAMTFGVRPQLVSLAGGPGGTRTIPVTLRNYDTRNAIRVYLGVADALQELDGRLQFATPGRAPFSCAPWISLPSTEVTIPANASKEVPVRFTVPRGNIRGSYHAFITISSTPPTPAPANPDVPVAAGMRIAYGIIVHFDISGTLKPEAQIEDIAITNEPPTSYATSGDQRTLRWLAVRVANTGNSLLSLYGSVTIRNNKGALKGNWPIGGRDGSRLTVYPGRRVVLKLPIKTLLASGAYQAEARLVYARGKTAFGQRQLTVTKIDEDDISTEYGNFQPMTIGLAVQVEQEMYQIDIAPGGVRTGMMLIRNFEEMPVAVTADVFDVQMENDGALTPFRHETEDASDWLKVRKQEFTLHPGEQRKVAFSLRIPKDAKAPGDRFGIVKFQARTLNPVTRERGPELIGESMALVIASMPQLGVRKLTIEQPQTSIPLDGEGDIKLGVPLVNAGTVHCTIGGVVQAARENDPAFSWEAPFVPAAERPLILPGVKRTLWIALPRRLFLPGEYLVTLSITYGAAEPLLHRIRLKINDEAGAVPAPGGGQPADPEDTKKE